MTDLADKSERGLQLPASRLPSPAAFGRRRTSVRPRSLGFVARFFVCSKVLKVVKDIKLAIRDTQSLKEIP